VTGVATLADAIADMGALSCNDGRHYHEWEVNGSPVLFKNSYTVTWGGGLGIRKEPTQGAEEIGEVSAGTTVEGLKEDGDWLQIQHEGLVGWTVLRDGDGKNYTPKMQHFKYISSAPDVQGQDDDPSVPISNGMCQRCGNPKCQHTAKGAMTKINISSNDLRAEGGKALAAGLKGNQVITELNISSNTRLGVNSDYDDFDGDHGPEEDVSGVIAIADAIPDMEALSKFDISSNALRAYGAKALATALEGNQVITELNIASNEMSRNDRVSDISGINALSDAISGMGVLLSLDISSNGLYVEGTKLLAKALESNQTMTSLNISSNGMTFDGVAALADVLPGMEAMTSLNLASNDLRIEGAKIVAAVLPKCM
jgi:hypothetical protein